jgi:hypothetical protein
MVITVPVLNIDLSPTIAELASGPLSDADGESFLPLIEGSGEWSREAFLIEHLGRLAPGRTGRGVPTYCVHTPRHVFVVYGKVPTSSMTSAAIHSSFGTASVTHLGDWYGTCGAC